MRRTNIYLDDDLAAIDASFGALADDDIEIVRGPDDRSRHLEELWQR